MKYAVIPSSWLALFPWNVRRLIQLQRTALRLGVDLHDLAAIRSLYLSLL